MTHDVDAIYDQGVFRPLIPLVLPDGTRVHLRVEQGAADTAGEGVVDWLLACPEKDWFQSLPSESTDTLSR
jgi:predicted DNA-binding antitoxin AbrB/MazE fold protein